MEVDLSSEFETILATHLTHLYTQTVMTVFAHLVGHRNCAGEIRIHACLYFGITLSEPPL